MEQFSRRTLRLSFVCLKCNLNFQFPLLTSGCKSVTQHGSKWTRHCVYSLPTLSLFEGPPWTSPKPALHLFSRGKHRLLQNRGKSQKSRVPLKKKAYTHLVAHTSPQNILYLFKFTKKKRKKYNRINTTLIQAIVRSQYQQGPQQCSPI